MNNENLVIEEWRGVEGLVAAEVLIDDNGTNTAGQGETPNHGYVTGEVFDVAAASEITKTTEESTDAHYYNNIPAITVTSQGADTININASAIPLDVRAKITGQKYDENKGALIEGERERKYFAIGYKTKKTNGNEMYVWRLKGTFNNPDETNATINNGTDANGDTLVFTNIATTHKFTNNNNKGAKSLIVDVAKDKADVSTFFETVTTPDTLPAKG